MGLLSHRLSSFVMYSSTTTSKGTPFLVVNAALAVLASTFGEPDAAKAARPVRRGTVGNVLPQGSNALAVYPMHEVAGSIPATVTLHESHLLKRLEKPVHGN